MYHLWHLFILYVILSIKNELLFWVSILKTVLDTVSVLITDIFTTHINSFRGARMSLALIPSEVVTDCFGVKYWRICVCGNGFCAYNSLSLCLTGTEEHHDWVIEDCIQVFSNCPDLLFQRTNFRATNPTREAVSQCYWLMRNAINRVRHAESLAGHDDELFWMEDGHIVAISLLYDIAVFNYSTIARKWYAFNEQGRNGYVRLLSSANHTDVLHGMCDSNGRYLPPTIPETFESQAVSPAAFNWSESVALSIQRQYSYT